MYQVLSEDLKFLLAQSLGNLMLDRRLIRAQLLCEYFSRNLLRPFDQDL